MKKAWIIINHFLNSNKFNELYEFFRASAKTHGIELKVYTNSEAYQLAEDNAGFPDFILFWDKDIRLGRLLESRGARLFNSPSAIELSDDKYLTYLALKKAKLPLPETVAAPMTYHNIGYREDFGFIGEYGKRLGYPMVIKEVFGSFGEQVYLAESHEAAIEIIRKTDCRPVIFQKFISYSSGRDIRINIVGGKAVASMERRSENGDFRANLTIGGKMKKITPDEKAIKLATEACRALGLDFGGGDLLYTENGYLICEVNSNAHFKNIMELTGVNIADKIFEYILEKI